MKKITSILTITTILIPLTAYTQCITPPDCASIGYTETSCEGDGLKCPFDTSKLYCPPCDSSYKYTCSGDNIKNPIGDTCNNKYAACECIKGAIFTNGECFCDSSCSIGNLYYSDGSCSSCLYENKNPIGIVVKDDELIFSIAINNMFWGPDIEDIPTMPNFTTAANAITDFAGKNNTATLIEHFGEDADPSNHAALYCYTLSPTGAESTKGKWYLPAAGELYTYVYGNYNKLSSSFSNLLSKSINYNYWSSTEWSARYAWFVSAQGNMSGFYTKYASNHNTRCFLEI